MTPEQATAMYRRRISQFEIISLRCYTGTGANRPRFDWDVQARVLGKDGKELIGPITETGAKLIVLHEDLEEQGFPFPILKGPNWKAIVRGKEFQIEDIDGNTRRLGGLAIAYDITVSG